MSDVIVAPETRNLASLADQLCVWLGSRMPHATQIRLTDLAYPRGAGQSHETILFNASWLAGSQQHSEGFVIRIKPGRHTVFPDDLFDEQYRLMRVLHEHGRVRVARPICLEEDPSILGAPFFLMEKVVGRVAVSVPPYAQTGWVAQATATQRARLWRNGVTQLAAVQSVPLSSVAFLRGKRQGAEAGLEQEWDKYVRFAEWVQRDRPWPVLDVALRRLHANWPLNRPPGLVWGDARLGNIMFDDDLEVVAVMDWEQPSLGGALHDLAWWLVLSEMMHGAIPGRAHLEGMGTREETIALWRQLTCLSSQDIEWYEAFTKLKISCLSIRTAALRGTPPPDTAWLAKRLGIDPIVN